MPNKKTDRTGFNTDAPDVERDIAGKGGPAVGPGIADDSHGIAAPYDEDTQTQLAAKSTEKPTKPGRSTDSVETDRMIEDEE